MGNRISSRQFKGKGGGAVVVALALDASPFVAVYKFTDENGWGTRYSDPSVIPSYTLEARSVAWGPQQNRLHLTGYILANSLFRYIWTDLSGFSVGTAVEPITDARTVTFPALGDRILVAAPAAVSEYEYAAGSIGTKVYDTATGGTQVRQTRLINDDEYVIVGFSDTVSHRIYRRNASGAPTLTYEHPSFYGEPSNFSLGNVLGDGTRPLMVPHSSGFKIFRFNTTTGVTGTEITPTFGSAVQFATFDPYGRLIVAETSSPFLNIYTMDSSGTLTLVDTEATFAGGVVRGMVYDDELDVLFVSSESAPYITAIKMSGAGFRSIYSDPSTSVGTAVLHASIKYDENWKPST